MFQIWVRKVQVVERRFGNGYR